MVDKQKCVDAAMRKGYEYTTKYWGCAQSTFAAIVDTLRDFDIELTSEEAEEAIFKSLVGLSGGHANMNIGNCGALTGAAMAISLVSGVNRQKQLDDKEHRWIAFDNVAKTIGQKFLEEYGGLTCRDVTWKRFGKWWDSWNPEAKADFSREEKERGCLAEGKCTISRAAGWGVGYILDILENPRTLEQVKKDHDLS
jgi:C_GCAxxG_C_C family probable redox protein